MFAHKSNSTLNGIEPISFRMVEAVARKPCAEKPILPLPLKPMRSSARFSVVAVMQVFGLR